MSDTDALKELVEKVKTLPPMTPDQIREQRISFVYGQLMDAKPEVTKEEVTQIHDEIYGNPALIAKNGGDA